MATGASAEPFTWQAKWFDACGEAAMLAWRCVESQSQISTWQLVSSREEHEALEAMLEASKPPLPEGAQNLHYLLSTPFRYTSPCPTRFRRPSEAGIWYGAESIDTVCAELAYWRYRFIQDCAGLAKDPDGLLTQHTIFRAQVHGRALDLAQPPWDAGRALWTHGSDYTHTQSVAAAARMHGIEWIRYESVRLPGTYCAAVLEARALAQGGPMEQQDWICWATRTRVVVSRADKSSVVSWDF
ncbi:MAG: RES domain-containing protein [Burkholderiales bacterium]|nr:MAG: RES domain-containing protein [Burkholderiales bacterium]